MRAKNTVLHLSVKAEYFNEIASGQKLEEYRLATPYWRKRLEGRTFEAIEITLGYPPADDTARRILRPWHGAQIKTITHEHFGTTPVTVYAIRVNL